MAALPFPAEIDVAFALMLIVDIQRIPHERIGQSLTQLHRLQGPGVGDPACAVIYVPLLTLRDETGNALEYISEQSAVADVVPRIAVILRRMERNHDLLEIVEIIRRRRSAHGLVELGTHRHGLGECGLSVIVPIPLIPHQSRLPEQPVHLFGIAAAPERQHRTHGRICLTVALSVRDDAVPQGFELFALFGGQRPLKDGGIGEVAARSGHTGHRLFGSPHIFFKHLHQSVRPLLDTGAADGVAGHRDETARVPSHIDLQLDLPVIDVIAVLVIGRERGFEQNPHAGTGRAVFRIGIHPGDDVLGHIRQHAVLDTAIDVDGTDVPKNADADSVISGTVPDGDGIIRKGALIRRIRTEAVRLIRHLGPAPVTLLIFPEAEGTSFL